MLVFNLNNYNYNLRKVETDYNQIWRGRIRTPSAQRETLRSQRSCIDWCCTWSAKHMDIAQRNRDTGRGDRSPTTRVPRTTIEIELLYTYIYINIHNSLQRKSSVSRRRPAPREATSKTPVGARVNSPVRRSPSRSGLARPEQQRFRLTSIFGLSRPPTNARTSASPCLRERGIGLVVQGSK